MKTKRYKLLLLLILQALLLQSCLKNQEDSFSENASQRLIDLTEQTTETLISSENGWVLDYYFGNTVTVGGSAMTLVFKDGIVKAYGELDTTKVYESHWSMKGNNSAVLSFDTYNPLLHAYATPTSTRYEGYQGDFEFTIDSIANNEIYIHSTRNEIPMVLRRLDKSYKQYVKDEVSQVKGNYLERATANIDGTDVTIAYDWENRVANISYLSEGDTTKVSMPFTYTDKGIRFFKPVNITEKKLSNFEFVDDDVMENVHYKTLDPESSEVVFNAKYRDGYKHRDAWGGDYIFTYYADHDKTSLVNQKVTLTYRPDSLDYIMTGFKTIEKKNRPVRPIPIKIEWDRSTGLLQMKPQIIEEYPYRKRYNLVMWFEFNYPNSNDHLRNKRGGFAFVTIQDSINKNVYHWGNNGIAFMTNLEGEKRWADSFLFICQYQNEKGTPLFFPEEYPHIYFIQSLTKK